MQPLYENIVSGTKILKKANTLLAETKNNVLR